MTSLAPNMVGLLLAIFACAAAAQTYPAKQVRLIVPFSPGGGTDVLARVINQKLHEALGQPVVIDNRPGAGANIGAELAAKSPPDGYTLLMVTISHAINASLYAKLNYDLVRDFAPVTLLAVTAHLVVVHPSVPAKTVRELVTLARARPGQIDYASSGSGSSAHLAAALFTSMAGVEMNHIPYKGGGPAVIALLGGEASVGFPTLPSVITYAKSGKLRALAVTSVKRSPSAPQVPTVAEAGVPGYEVGSWYGLLAPAGTPREIITRLHTETVKLLKVPDVRERLDAAGFEVFTSTPEQYAAFTRNEVDKWARVVKATGVRQE
jgi:tripartite-type tricarboxylate transporter receptor subunit TctC